MNVKPVTSLDDRILDLWRAGASKYAVACATRASVLDVERALQRGRYRGDERAAVRGRGPSRVARLSIPAGLVDGMAAEARRRNMSPALLAELLLIRVTHEGRFGAILDDGGQN